MKYTIEIVRHDDDGTRKVLHRFASDAISPAIAKAEATRRLRRVPEAKVVSISRRCRRICRRSRDVHVSSDRRGLLLRGRQEALRPLRLDLPAD